MADAVIAAPVFAARAPGAPVGRLTAAAERDVIGENLPRVGAVFEMLYESLQRFARILHPDFRREALKADHAVQIGAVVHEARAAVGGIAHFRFKAEPVLCGRTGQRGDLGGIARAAVIDERDVYKRQV